MLHICIFVLQETDAALLSIISFPAFAVDDQELVDLTRETVVEKLQVLSDMVAVSDPIFCRVWVEGEY